MIHDKKSEGWKRLQALRTITEMSGELHEEQARNIVLWSRVAVQRSSSADLRWDPETRGLVITMKMGKGREPAKLKSRLALFLASVREILGPCSVRLVSGETDILNSPMEKVSQQELAQNNDNTVRDIKPQGGGELATERSIFSVQQLREAPLSWAQRLKVPRGPRS